MRPIESKNYTQEQKEEARKLYLTGMTVPEIEVQLSIHRRSIYDWAKEESWGEVLNGVTALYAANRRLLHLIDRENKTETDFREIETLSKLIEKLGKKESRDAKSCVSYSSDKSDSSGRSDRSDKKKIRRKNDFTDIDPIEVYNTHFMKGLFPYQLECWDELQKYKTRQYLKSRQIGFTYYFAREALMNALMTGNNQIFISASRNQSDVFRTYIKEFVREWFDGYELKGKDTVELHTPNGMATLYFLSTNSATAQSYSGNLYIDEYFWIPSFEKFNKVASAMASQASRKITYFSTPSAKSHEAYPIWSMDKYNERMKSASKPMVAFPSKDELKKGIFCPDMNFRKVITLYDAQAKGCNLFDIDYLKAAYSEYEFKQLFCCEFIDDTASVFKLSMLEKCITDSSLWKDFKPEEEKPYKYPVWIGYDPSRNGDGACIVVLAPPLKINGKFRVLERIRLFNQTWQFQAEVIRELTKKYTVDYIGIDLTGPGSGVFEMVVTFYPAATPIYYTLDSKTKLILKGQQVITDQRLEWDASYSDIPAGFMQIRQTTTQSGLITYVADRTEKSGHADSAWAILHALIKEGLLRPDEGQKASVSFED